MKYLQLECLAWGTQREINKCSDQTQCCFFPPIFKQFELPAAIDFPKLMHFKFFKLICKASFTYTRI